LEELGGKRNDFEKRNIVLDEGKENKKNRSGGSKDKLGGIGQFKWRDLGTNIQTFFTISRGFA